MAKHVVILGAGASSTSGYPLARRLSLLMSDQTTLIEEIVKQMDTGDPSSSKHNATAWVQRLIAETGNVSTLMREGCFATMDEMGSLCARHGDHSDLLHLKRLMTFCLALYNPEQFSYAHSDYTQLINNLLPSASVDLPKDISFLSFNYDPYLDYLLHRCLARRSRMGKNQLDSRSIEVQRVTSGFSNFAEREWLKAEGFVHLKLHGVIALPPNDLLQSERPRLEYAQGNEPLTSEILFKLSPYEKCRDFLVGPLLFRHQPFVFLPWELFDDNGTFRDERSFVETIGRAQAPLAAGYKLIRGVWERAREEVQSASKVSFVGTTLSPLLNSGMKFLFNGKRNKFKVVVANPEVNNYRRFDQGFHLKSPASRTAKSILLATDQTAEFKSSCSDTGESLAAPNGPAKENFHVGVYQSFSDFIHFELTA